MVSRRTLLAGAAGTVGGLTLAGTAAAEPPGPPPAPPVPPPGPAVAHTLSQHRRIDARTIRVPITAFPLTHLAVSWTGAQDAAGIRLRTRRGWGYWQPLHGCATGRDGGGTHNGALLVASDVVGYELQTPETGSVTEINTVDGPVRTRAAAQRSGMRLRGEEVMARYLSRAAWGADESLRVGDDGTELFPEDHFPVQTVTIHHTATANEDPDPAATMRAIQFDHSVTRAFGDIGYHLAIDESGRVYEGRWSGDDPLPVLGSTAGPDGRPLMNNAAHVGGFNAGNVGIALIGDLTTRPPTDVARRTLTRVLATLVTVAGLDPLGTTAYVNPISGAARTVGTVSGHRDWLATECPGGTFGTVLPELRRDVADLLDGPARSRP